jgi:UDP:flavonoid glycosyltransferase YjiC (YdhE family)
MNEKKRLLKSSTDLASGHSPEHEAAAYVSEKQGGTMKIGFVSLPLSGHLNPMTALARRLQSRGHEVVFIGVPDVEPFARAAGLNFVPFCESECPAGSIAKLYAPVSKLRGLEVVRWSLRKISPELFSAASKHLPQKLAATGVESLVIDTIHTFLELVPMSLGMPYAQVWNVLNIDLSGATPPCLFSCPHESTPAALARNIERVKAAREIFAPVVPLAMAYAKKVGLDVDWSDSAATTSKLAVITQTPQEFDFPGIPWGV